MQIRYQRKRSENNDTYYFDNKWVTLLRFSSMHKKGRWDGKISYRLVYDTVQDRMRAGGYVQPA